ncbi:Uncharacterized protein Rs2_14306 [Raphanus sativus]|nr:Uncharacterized protein Rs2_14306 [Raphanus sativus]
MFSPPVLHFSTLHRRNLSVPLHCLSHLNVAWPVGEPNLPPALDSKGSGSARCPPPLVSRSRCQPPPLKPLGATLGSVEFNSGVINGTPLLCCMLDPSCLKEHTILIN